MAGLVSRKQVTIPANSTLLVDTGIRNVIHYDKINVVPLPPLSDWQAVTINGDPTSAGVSLTNGLDDAVTLNIMFEYPHSILGVIHSDSYVGATSAGCTGTTPGPARYILGDWRTSNVPRSFNAVIARATGQSTVETLRAHSKLVGIVVNMNNLGLVDAVTGSPLIIQAIRVSQAGVTDAAVTVASIAIGESNVSRSTLVEIEFQPGDGVYVKLVTDTSWPLTSTLDPTVKLEIEEIE